MSHAIERALERYGLTITISQIKEMARNIREGGGVLLRRAHALGAHDRYLVRHGDRDVIVVYSAMSHQIVTILPRKDGPNTHPKRKQVAAGPGKTKSHKGARRTRYIPEIDFEDGIA